MEGRISFIPLLPTTPTSPFLCRRGIRAKKFEKLGEVTKRRRFRLQGLICPVLKSSLPRGLHNGQVSATSARSEFSVQSKCLNSTEGSKCPRFSGVRDLNVFFLP
ncbi:hypothetical protein AHAS_Ahas18G0109000 [Arachis hypogaea]